MGQREIDATVNTPVVAPTSHRGPTALCAVLFLLAMIKGLFLVYAIPPWQGPDEPFHVKMAYLASPGADEDRFDQRLLASLVRNDFARLTDHSQSQEIAPNPSNNRMPLYYLLLGAIFRLLGSGNVETLVLCGRLFSLFLLACLLLTAHKIGTLIGENDSERAWTCALAVAFIGLHPQYSFFSITTTPDNLISLLSAATLLCSIAAVKELQGNGGRVDRRVAAYLCLSLVLGVVAVLSKRSGLIVLVFVFCAFSFLFFQSRRMKTAPLVALFLIVLFACLPLSGSATAVTDGRRSISTAFAGAAGAGFTLPGNHRYAANKNGTSDIFSMDKYLSKMRRFFVNGVVKLKELPEVPLSLIVRFFLVQFVSFWFSIGWMVHKLNPAWYAFWGLVSLVILIGVFRGMLSRGRSAASGKMVLMLIGFFAITLFAQFFIYGPRAGYEISSEFGRCRFIHIGAVAGLFSYGMYHLLRDERAKTLLARYILVFLIVFSLYTTFFYTVPSFYPV